MQNRQLPFFLGDTSHSCLVLIIQLISQKDREIQQVSGEIRIHGILLQKMFDKY